MGMNPLKITFHMDGTGTFYDPAEPMHLDGIMGWALAIFQTAGEPPAADEEPFEVQLPLGRWEINGSWGWHASAIFPVGDIAGGMQSYTKRFRTSRVEYTNGTPNTKMGTYRDHHVPMPLILNTEFEAFALGDRGRVQQILKKHIRFLGRKRAIGKGRIVDVTTEIIDHDLSLTRNGLAMRYLPSSNGSRMVRPRPPYWNSCGRVACLNPGDEASE